MCLQKFWARDSWLNNWVHLGEDMYCPRALLKNLGSGTTFFFCVEDRCGVRKLWVHAVGCETVNFLFPPVVPHHLYRVSCIIVIQKQCNHLDVVCATTECNVVPKGSVTSGAVVCGCVVCGDVVPRSVVCGAVMCGAVVCGVVCGAAVCVGVVSRGLVCATVVCGAMACGAMLCGAVVC